MGGTEEKYGEKKREQIKPMARECDRALEKYTVEVMKIAWLIEFMW